MANSEQRGVGNGREARAEILTRLRGAADVAFRGRGEDAPSRPPSAVTSAEGDRRALAERFGLELEQVLGSYEIVSADRVVASVGERLRSWRSDDADDQDRSAPAFLSWAPGQLPVHGLDGALRAAGPTPFVPDDLRDPEQRRAAADVAIGVTSADAAFASTGSVVLTPAAGRSRAASLLPLRHLILVPFSRLFPTVEAWLAELRSSRRLTAMLRERRQWTFVTGPSKSADIELNLTVGVHGPGVVHAVLFDDHAAG